jgi:hypothetical protein
MAVFRDAEQYNMGKKVIDVVEDLLHALSGF